ncbi:uncharacterized protein DFL_003327 [Arthrobotrys flagrans]|uniref:Uncharacterized protein n=1 Tax=Arthrobotrys flagrans TaxID=97331 RepID=A0A437A1J6_ARTFL|nr:hypothetical protein DFL_003327 [Arthrobotrys flagrans]
MFFPPEILLSILEELKTDRNTLHNLRLVDKYFCQAATDILFGNFSVHYGFKHSVPQMKAIIKSPGLQPYIRSLHLPSESFFPIAKNFTLRVGGSYRFPWSRDLSKEVEPPTRRNCYQQETDSENYRGYMEVPTNRRARFSFNVKRYKNEYDRYTKTLTGFLKACVNLRAIHITTGLGYDAERSETWCSMIKTDVFPILAKHKVKKLEISAASGDCLFRMIDGYEDNGDMNFDQLPMFPSVKSLAIKTHCKARFEQRFNRQGLSKLNNFLSTMTNLTAYSISNTELKVRAVELLPTRCTDNITSLDLGCMLLNGEIFETFKSMISSMRSLTDLTLDTVVLCLSANLQLEDYPERRLPKGMSPTPPPERIVDPFNLFGHNGAIDATDGLFGPFGQSYTPQPVFNFDMFTLLEEARNIPTYAFTDLSAGVTWKSVFDMLQERLPKLTEFYFKRLVYTGPRALNGRNILLYIPVQDLEDYNRRDFQRFARGAKDMELVSTLESDYLALEDLRNTVNERRQKCGLVELKSDTKSEGFGKVDSGNDAEGLGKEIPGFEHQTKNKRIIIVPHHNLWQDSGSCCIPGNSATGDLCYWRI